MPIAGWKAGKEYLRAQYGDEKLAWALSQFRELKIEVPSWGFGRGGNRFAVYVDGSEPTDLEGKLEQAGKVYEKTGQGQRVALHFPWDGEGPQDAERISNLLQKYNLRPGAINSNLFSPRPGGLLNHQLRLGSFTNPDANVRKAAVQHNLACLEIGRRLGSGLLSIWIPDGSNSPGQTSLYDQADWLEDCLRQIYDKLQPTEKMLLEYKFFEPGLYSTAVPDWGRALSVCEDLGAQAAVLVDLGHHPLGTNIEQIVALLIRKGRLGGFHINDKKYADDDLAAGSIDPAQLFRIFVTILEGVRRGYTTIADINFTIDQSHCIKNPTEEMIESVESIEIAFMKACLVDYEALEEARREKDISATDRILRNAFTSDPRPLIGEAKSTH